MTDLETKFMNEDEMFQDLMKVTGPGDQMLLANTPKESLIQFHHGLGQHIRNNYHLWEEDNPNTETKDPEMTDGVITDERFPDAVSQRLIERMWAALQ